MLSVIFCLLLSSSFSFMSCSEENAEEDEYANWKARNEEMTERWAQMAANGQLTKYLTYSKEQSASGLTSSDYIYVEVLSEGSGTESPIFTDYARMAYRGHLIPTASYSEGRVFDQTFLGDFDWKTAGMVDMTADIMCDGFSTALMNMNVGDYWRVYMPYQLGYGSAEYSGIPAYSNLVFEIALKDFWHVGDNDIGKFKSR